MRIKNWHKFQHFKDRRPPWIKLYRELLDDPEWFELSPRNCKILVMLWLLASEDKELLGKLPDIKTISFRLRLSESDIISSFSELNHWVDMDNIKTISRRYQDDAPETETETDLQPREEVNLYRGIRGGFVPDEDGRWINTETGAKSEIPF